MSANSNGFQNARGIASAGMSRSFSGAPPFLQQDPGYSHQQPPAPQQAFNTPGTPTRNQYGAENGTSLYLNQTPAKKSVAPKKHRTNHRSGHTSGSYATSAKQVVDNYNRQALSDSMQGPNPKRFPGTSSSAGGGYIKGGQIPTSQVISRFSQQLNSRRGSHDSSMGTVMNSVDRHMNELTMQQPDTPQGSQQPPGFSLTPMSPMNLGGPSGGTLSRGQSPGFLHGAFGQSASQVRQSQASQFTTDHSMFSHSQSVMSTHSQFAQRRIMQEFTEVCELGRGNFGVVSLVQEAFSGDYFAVKALPIQTPRDRQRKMQERAVLAATRGFPHCVELYNSWIEGNRQPTLFLQLQLCPNGSVADMFATRRTKGELWREVEVLTFLGQMALALDALHTANIAHVDFKPENVLVDEKYNYILTDFGLAAFLDPHSGRPVSSSVFASGGFDNAGATQNDGSNGYNPDLASSMESQLSQDEGDCRYTCSDMLNQKRFFKAGDVFALGITLYEMMSGQALPRNGPQYLELRNRTNLDELLQAPYEFTDQLVNLVLQMIQPEPSARPSMREILESPLLCPNEHSSKLLSKSMSYWSSQCRNEFEANPNDQGTMLDTAVVRYHQTCFSVSSYLLQSLTSMVIGINPNPRGAVAEIVQNHFASKNEPLPGPPAFDEDVIGPGDGRPSNATTCAWSANSNQSPDARDMQTPVNRML